jgi:hypothetical protein
MKIDLNDLLVICGVSIAAESRPRISGDSVFTWAVLKDNRAYGKVYLDTSLQILDYEFSKIEYNYLFRSSLAGIAHDHEYLFEAYENDSHNS